VDEVQDTADVIISVEFIDLVYNEIAKLEQQHELQAAGGAQQQQQQQQQQQPQLGQQPGMPRLQPPQGQQQQQPMMQNQVRNQQFMNQNPQMAMQQQQQQPMMGQQDQMNMNSWQGVPGAGPNANQMKITPQPTQQQQLRQGINSSPLMPQQPTPMLLQQQPMPGPQQMPMQPQPPIAKPTAAQKAPAKTTVKKGTQGRKKSKANNNAGTAPTPAAMPAATPGALANAIKTPHSIPTPQIPPQSHSNKNTPSAHSPAYPVKATPSGATPGTSNFGGSNANNVYPTPEIDVFAMSSNDSKVAKRRELLNSDPEKFFYASLANLLDLDESIVENVKVSPRMSNGKAAANSPLSPKVTGEWTSDVKPMAITTSFRQVETIKELTSDDIIASCGMLAIQEVEEPKLVKREREQDDELDTLFNDKKLKLEDGNNFDKFLYEPASFDEWKDFVVSFIQ
jgi:mediator of RNA polymerase II transcription subunit 15